MAIFNLSLPQAKSAVNMALAHGDLVILSEPHNDVPHAFSFAAEAVTNNSSGGARHSLFLEAPVELEAGGGGTLAQRAIQYFKAGVTNGQASELMINLATTKNWHVKCVDSQWGNLAVNRASEKRQKDLARRIIHHFNNGGHSGGILPIGTDHVKGLKLGRNQGPNGRVVGGRPLSPLNANIPAHQMASHTGYYRLGTYIAGQALPMYKFTASADYSTLSSPGGTRDLLLQIVPHDSIFRPANAAI